MKNWNSNRLAKPTQRTQPYQFPSSLGVSKASQNYCLYDDRQPPSSPMVSSSMPPLITSNNNNEGENNLKSDFVKYLSQINRFDDGATGTTYDNNNILLGISPMANEINFSSNVEMFPVSNFILFLFFLPFFCGEEDIIDLKRTKLFFYVRFSSSLFVGEN